MAPRKRGRPRRDVANNQQQPEKTGDELEEVVSPPPMVKKRGRKPRAGGVGAVKKPMMKRGRKKLPKPQGGVTNMKEKRGRQVKKSVRDILELLPRKPVKPQVVQEMNEEELQEQRYVDEMQQLNTIEEGLLYCHVKDAPDSGEETDGEEDFEESDDDDLREELGRCPRPGPRKGRGGSKFVKGKNLDVELSKDEIEEMTMLIKGSVRKSLLTNKTFTDVMDELNQQSEIQAIAPPTTNMEVVPVQKSQKDPNYAFYTNFRARLDHQKLAMDHFKSRLTDRDYDMRGHIHYFLSRNSFQKQLCVEHLSWLSVMESKHDVRKLENLPLFKNGVLAWFDEFRKTFSWRYGEEIEGEAFPNSNTNLDRSLKCATVSACARMHSTLNQLVKTRQALMKLSELLTKVSNDKRKICEDFELVHESLNIRHAKFDESSVWGLKPIRLALEPPYFKSEDGMMSAPATPDAYMRYTPSYSLCFFKRDKQKWTTKDLDQLQSCIYEVLLNGRLSMVEDKYDSLMEDCLRRYESQMATEGRFDMPPLEPFRRGRGRPRKTELELTSRYGAVHPVIFKLPNGIVARNEVTTALLSEWRTNEERKLKFKSYEELVVLAKEKIDWAAVANKMVIKSRKSRSAEDCELAWMHEVHPTVNNKRWTKEDSERLAEIYKTAGTDWSHLAAALNRPARRNEANASKMHYLRTSYQCFFRVRNKIEPPKKIEWNDDLDEQLLKKLQEYPGNWRIVAASITNAAATKRQCIERYKKTINPVLRSGPFTRVEDCLLILTIEKLKPFLAREGHFGCLLSYLPWRCETTWRDRANNLFSDWIVPWTLEEDQMLLELAETMNRNWQQISEEFTSFKNRKGCLTRFKILKARLADEKFGNSLEAYHEAYSMTRYNVFQYRHLKDVLKLLRRVKDTQLPPEFANFVGLLKDEKPTEVRLQHMLLTFDRDILNTTIHSLDRYIETRDNYWKNWIEHHGKKKRTFDRRTFHPENPQSVASALHIRGLELKRREEIPNLNDFESEVLKYYARFTRTKALKSDAKRPYLPEASVLAEWSQVSRLIASRVANANAGEKPTKKKWKTLQGEDMEETTGEKRTPLRKGPKPRKETPKVKKEASTSTVKRAKISKRRAEMQSRDSTAVETTSEGYILIPPDTIRSKDESSKKTGSAKRRKIKEDNDDDDPEYAFGLVDGKNEEMADSNLGTRRSVRVRKSVPIVQYDLSDDDID